MSLSTDYRPVVGGGAGHYWRLRNHLSAPLADSRLKAPLKPSGQETFQGMKTSSNIAGRSRPSSYFQRPTRLGYVVPREMFHVKHPAVFMTMFHVKHCHEMASLEKPALAKTVYTAVRVAGFMKNKLLTDTKA
jgi:hypothetical protein